MNAREEPQGGARASLTTRIVDAFLGSHFSVLLILLCIAMGAVALLVTPREEDPQIVVPFVDVLVETPGSGAAETRALAAEPLERLMAEIPGVEHVYSMSRPGQALVTVRFEVGQDRERALVNVRDKIESNLDRVPPQVARWVVKPVEIDDVPILTLTLYTEEARAAELVRYADELAARLQQVADVSRVDVAGGERRVLRVLLDPARLRARHLAPLDVARALGAANVAQRTGQLLEPESERVIEVGGFLRDAEEVAGLRVASPSGAPIFVRDVADVLDGPDEPSSYTRIGFGPGAAAVERGDPVPPEWVDGRFRPAVTLAVSKRKGTNAVTVAQQVLRHFESLRAQMLPEDVRYLVTRNYGETADEKVNELVGHLLIAVGTIVVLIGASLGWRAALIVALAVPLTLAVTLFADLLVGYTINRVTLFALILSLGLLVDDPIVDVENIHRHLSLGRLPPREATLHAVDEIRPPVILATLAVIASFLPMFFVGGMMGPYMRPMPFNVPVAMLLSLLVAFTITPWASYHLLKHEPQAAEPDSEGRVVRAYRWAASYLVATRRRGLVALALIAAAFLASVGMAALGWVPLKMLPFDNKSEFQIVVDAPEGTPLERTDRAVQDLMRVALKLPETSAVTSYTGRASPHDFNGLVRHYFLRRGGHVADLRVDLIGRHERARQTHAIVLAARPELERVAAEHGVHIALVESPPGPPVLAGVVAEVRGPLGASDAELDAVATEVERRFQRVPFLRDVDSYVERALPKTVLAVDREAAAARGLGCAEVVDTLRIALSGLEVGVLHAPGERLALPIRLELPRAARSNEDDLLQLSVPRGASAPVPLADLVVRRDTSEDTTLYRKDLRELQYVVGEAAGKSPVDAIFALQADLAEHPLPAGWEVELAGEGEWQVTVDVFRDLGLAFAGALGAIYVLLVAQTRSFGLSAIIMLAIPLTMVGVFPGFWLLNKLAAGSSGDYELPIFFTATGMIGVIALAGIVVRNAIILVDFIEQNRARGMPVLAACVEAGAVRLRPIALTAGAAVLGAWVIVFDPIFSGLAWSFVFGILASTTFTLFVVPIAYALLRAQQPPLAPEPAASAPREVAAQQGLEP